MIERLNKPHKKLYPIALAYRQEPTTHAAIAPLETLSATVIISLGAG